MENPETKREEQPSVDRRQAMKTVARYAAYTAPTMAVLMTAGSDEAEASGWWWKKKKKVWNPWWKKAKYHKGS